MSLDILPFVAKELGMDQDSLLKFVKSCPHRYKEYRIPKRNGRGFRDIRQPSRELKYIQRMLVDKYISRLPVHHSCVAYREGINILENASRHSKNKYFLKMDFKDFFPSIVPKNLVDHMEEFYDESLSEMDRLVISRVFFCSERRGTNSLVLSIGAPSSPSISNTLMYNFDVLMDNFSKKNGSVYTRYADDICFSSPDKNRLWEYPNFVQSVCSDLTYPSLRINQEKTVFVSQKENVHITGLVITPSGKVSIGRSNKRRVKAQVFSWTKGCLPEDELCSLSGYLAFCISVEPEFFRSLVSKYGESVMSSILRHSGR